MRVDAGAVLARRRREREALLATAQTFAASLDPAVGIQAVCVFGSVARGDFNRWSDIDVLVVAERLPDHPVRRLEALGASGPGVQPVAWTPAEWRQRLAKRDPIAVEALSVGVWIVGEAPAAGG